MTGKNEQEPFWTDGANLNLNKIYNQDCMDGMKEIPDKFFDLAIVDPPYFSDRSAEGFTAGVSARSACSAIMKNLKTGQFRLQNISMS